MEKYRSYFDIDPDYFPAVNPDVINNNPELWKKFYPHDTFIKLIKDTVSILNRTQKVNIWVEGAYGTGKSHAVLTLKRLLESTTEETSEYFSDFNLDEDLLKKFLQAKGQGRILTVHRYASSSIKSDNDLYIAIQESIEQALKEIGISRTGSKAMKDAMVKYLSDEVNKQTFSIYVDSTYRTLFGGETIDEIIAHLNDYTEDALRELMRKILKVANERQIRAFTLDDKGLCEWIREVIQENQLNSLIFIWDEFTEYFQNNVTSLTGFQTLLELSATEHFCFIPVTHRSDSLFNDADKMKSKILGRFMKPRCIIELPENMAFQLMGAAMKKKNDPVVKESWDEIIQELKDRTKDSRIHVKKATGLSDNELEGILPLHPYAASLLKHISTSFDSNQRSMFDFIKNNKGDETQAFQWFIDNYGPYDTNPLLTIDMLWNFFYEMGKDSLALNIRQILDNFPRLNKNHQLSDVEIRLLKTVLLFQAISFEVRDDVDLFLANEKNLNCALEGSDFDYGEPSRIAEKLVNDQVLFRKPVGKGFVYAVLVGEMNSDQINKYKELYEKKTTSTLIQEGIINEVFELPASLKLRYNLSFVCQTDFDSVCKKLAVESRSNKNNIFGVVTIAKDEKERTLITQKIKTRLEENPNDNIIYIDCGKTVFGEENFMDWVEYKAKSHFFSGKDKDQAQQNARYANDLLAQWRQNIKMGAFVYYSQNRLNGETLATADALMEELHSINKARFPLGLEDYSVINNMWLLNAAKQGVECGIKEDIAGTYRSSNSNTKLEKALEGAWGEKEYWKSNSTILISKIKIAIEELIRKKMKSEGRISIKEIFEFLKNEPYGFMACNFTAFIIGFLLKEYLGGKFSWSDGTTSDELSLEKMKEMVDEVLKLENTPNSRYRDKYIVSMTPEEKSFIEITSESFGISKNQCTSIESARERVRAKMKELSFPLWSLEYILDNLSFETEVSIIAKSIQLYIYLVNNIKEESGKSENELAIEIGKMYIQNTQLASDLKKLFNSESCISGMLAFLKVYRDGYLPKLSEEIEDNNQYINQLRDLFAVDAANWVWRKDTAERVIDSVILDYEIITESNKLIDRSKSYAEVLKAWSTKASNMRLSYQSIKNDVGQLDALLGILYYLSLNDKIQDQNKQNFLNSIKEYGYDFIDFYNNKQFECFKKICGFELTGLSDIDKEKIFKTIPLNCFSKDKVQYVSIVTQRVEELKKGQSSMKLRDIWKTKTNTENPNHWSEIHRMPIFAMFKDEEVSECRKIFDIINSRNPDGKDVILAIDYLENADFFDHLNDEQQRNNHFVEKILGDNSILLDDVEEVKRFLGTAISDSAYNWYNAPAVKTQLEKMAQAKYNQGGYLIAFEKIDAMNPDEVKNYLKNLIKNNKNVGVEIVKNN